LLIFKFNVIFILLFLLGFFLSLSVFLNFYGIIYYWDCSAVLEIKAVMT